MGGEVVMAVYENGLLRPLTPLQLRERQRVRLQILPAEEVPETVVRTFQTLAASGLVMSCSCRSDLAPVSPERRQEIVHALAASGNPLSETILEERNKR